MTNSNLFLALGSSKKNFTSSANKKTSRSPIPTNVTASYRNILQESIANISRPPVRNKNNSPSKNSQIIRGDANGDGVVDKKDKSLFEARIFAELDGNGNSVKINMKNADFSGDGKITPEDYSEFLHIYYQQQKNNDKTLKGDVNGDGKVDIKDADLIELRTIGLADESNFDMNAADMDGDGEITHTDWFKVNQLIKENESNVKTLQGDSNGDGSVDESDYKNIDDYLSGKKSDENFIRKNSDVNSDGIVDEQDLKGVRNLLNGRPVDWDESRLGDANDDGKINAKDADLITLSSIGLLGKNLKFDRNYADFDNDGEITPIDVARINQLVNEKERNIKTLQGDSNEDGRVDETDYKNIKDYLDGRESTEDFIRKNSDINGDGNVNEKDLQGVRNILDGRKIDWDESKRHSGDVNGDGKIDIDDAVTITNHLNGKIQKKDFYWDNADVNHDGNIDLIDAVRIKKFYNGEISSLDQEITKVNPPFENAVITQTTGVYSDFYLINRNSQIMADTQVRVTGMSSDGTALEVIFPTSDGGEAIGWVDVENIKEYVPPPPPPDPYWEVAPPFTSGRAKFEKEVYGDFYLNSKVNDNEKIFAGETVRVTGMRSDGKVLRIVYTSVYGGEKERWVSADAIEEYIPPTPPPIPEALQNLINTYEGKIWKDETTGKGNFQCKDFAAYIFRQLYNVWYIGSTKSKDKGQNYMINRSDTSKIGILGEYQYLTKYNAQSLFADAKPGDFVQMRRSHGGSHSAIVGEITDEGVWFFEANAPDPDGSNHVYNKVKYQFHSWENLAAKNSGMSVYYAK